MQAQAGRITPGWDQQAALQAARRIGERALARAAQTERDRRVSDDIVAEIKAAGLLRMRQPTAFGGHERPALESFEVIHTLARYCASTAWVYCVLAGHAAQIALFPLQAQQEVWGRNPEALSSSAYAPSGTARTVEGGYRLTGRFPFSSGCDHAQWAMVGGLVEGPPGERPAMLIFLTSMNELTIDDDWFTLGLNGTGSKTLVADDVFIPVYRARAPGLFTGGVPPFSLGSVAVGAARGAADAFIAQAKTAPAGRRGRPADSESMQAAAALASAEADAAWLLTCRAVSETQAYSFDGFDIPQWLRARNRADNALITQLCVQAVDRVMAAGGGHAVYDESELQRRFRDVHAASQHVALATSHAARDAGGMMLNPDRPWP